MLPRLSCSYPKNFVLEINSRTCVLLNIACHPVTSQICPNQKHLARLLDRELLQSRVFLADRTRQKTYGQGHTVSSAEWAELIPRDWTAAQNLCPKPEMDERYWPVTAMAFLGDADLAWLSLSSSGWQLYFGWPLSFFFSTFPFAVPSGFTYKHQIVGNLQSYFSIMMFRDW